jgi:hypothetical protein
MGVFRWGKMTRGGATPVLRQMQPLLCKKRKSSCDACSHSNEKGADFSAPSGSPKGWRRLAHPPAKWIPVGTKKRMRKQEE